MVVLCWHQDVCCRISTWEVLEESHRFELLGLVVEEVVVVHFEKVVAVGIEYQVVEEVVLERQGVEEVEVIDLFEHGIQIAVQVVEMSVVGKALKKEEDSK